MYPKARETFSEEMAAMRANYGADKFPEAKCALIWEQLQEFSPKQIRNICGLIRAENNFAPVLAQFIEKKTLLNEKIRRWEREEERRMAFAFPLASQATSNLTFP